MVNPAPSTKKRIRTGVALSLTELCAADLRLRSNERRGWRTTLEPPESNGGGWPSLAKALRELGEQLGATDGRLMIALMPPLTEVRRLELPPLKREQVHQLLSRNASRYFVTAREPQIVGASVARRGPRGVPVPVLGAAASARLVEAIHAAARDAGWTIDGIVPAEIGWGAAATVLWPAFSKGVSHVLVHHTDRTDLLRLEAGQLAGVRRFRPGSLDASLIASTLEESRSNGTGPRVGSLGVIAPRQALASALAGERAPVTSPPADWNTPESDPMFVAATFATPDEGLMLRSDDAAEVRAAQGRRITMSIFAATIALLIAAAMLELWGMKRELTAVQAERARIRPQLQTTLSGRSSFEQSNRKLAALFAAQRESPYLSGVIASVTDALPEGSYVLSFRARRDTLVLDGLARNAAQAFDALSNVPELANVRSIAGVQRQLQDDGTALEHFTVQGRIMLPLAASISPIHSKRP